MPSVFKRSYSPAARMNPRGFSIALTCCAALIVLVASSLAADPLPVLEERAMKAAVAHVAPSVVRIETVGGLERVGQLLVGTGPTTGLIVSEDGYIISSAFNFVQKPDSILVGLADGTRSPAKLVATDHNRMLVLLKIATDAKLAVPEGVAAGEMRVGQWALAVGRTFEGGATSVSVGIVSALSRIWGKAVQTDAKISPTNYGGPLVDISGRVLGVLVPLTPDSGGEVAGVEWYDSGIGFAVSLEHINKMLPRLKEGRDLYSGLLGISLERGDQFSLPAKIAACRGGSPAFKSGLRTGDTIVEVDGRKIARQTELKHQLNHRYAGDKLRVTVVRGSERIEREIELIDKLAPYAFPFLGVLPERHVGDAPAGVRVRYVYPESPAGKTGVKAGDEIKSVAGSAVKDAADAAQKLTDALPGEKIKFEVVRDGKTIANEVALASLPESLPGELPPAHAAAPAPEGDRPQVGVISVKVPEFANNCAGFVPENYNPALGYGVVVWLHAPGGFKIEELVERWRALCEANDLILVAPQAADPTKWQPTEAAFVRKALDEVLKTYNVDRSRIVVHGHEAGGALAYVVALNNRDLVRAVAVVESPLPAMMQVPDNDPMQRLAIYSASASKGTAAGAIQAGLERIRAQKFPVVAQALGEQPRYLTAAELTALVQWIDTLDRF